MATCRTPPFQDGDEVLKCLEWRCQGIKNALEKKNALENLNTQENIKKDSNRYFAEKDWKILNFISQILALNVLVVYISEDTLQVQFH